MARSVTVTDSIAMITGRAVWQNPARNRSEATMNDTGSLPRHMLEVRELTPDAFAPYGQVIAPLRTGGQGTNQRGEARPGQW
jgi:hypothetical protein